MLGFVRHTKGCAILLTRYRTTHLSKFNTLGKVHIAWLFQVASSNIPRYRWRPAFPVSAMCELEPRSESPEVCWRGWNGKVGKGEVLSFPLPSLVVCSQRSKTEEAATSSLCAGQLLQCLPSPGLKLSLITV